MWIWWSLAAAAPPLPSYPDVLAERHWFEVDEILELGCRVPEGQPAVVCEPGTTQKARDHAEAFQRTLFRDPGLEYLIGLSHRYDGDDQAAERKLRSALDLDPEYVAAWYDLGELMLMASRFDQAATAFQAVSDGRAYGDGSWLGPWRLAEVAAHKQQPEAFEEHMREALRRGFTFRQIEGLPNWRAFYADPVMHDAVDKLLTVYAPPSVRQSLQPTSP